MKETIKYLGKKIREAREEKRITQKELGKRLGYSPMAISHFENGIRELKFSDIQKIASILNKELSFFLSSDTTLFRSEKTFDPDVEKSLKDFDKFINKK